MDAYRTPLDQRLLGAFGVITLGAMALGMAWLAAWVLTTNMGAGLFMLACTAGIGWLFAYVWRDAAAKWGAHVEFEAARAVFHLPAGRALTRQLPNFGATIEYAAMGAIETRLEAYRSMGMAAMQRAYALRLKSGELIILGEDRGLGSSVAQVGIGVLAAELARRAAIEITDLGMAEGKGGMLMVSGAAAPGWDSASLPDAAQARLWRQVMWTGALPIVAILLMLMMQSGG
ncbi:MAG: hypothetical protein U1E03_09990 [Hyphomonadaceae bacterium]